MRAARMMNSGTQPKTDIVNMNCPLFWQYTAVERWWICECANGCASEETRWTIRCACHFLAPSGCPRHIPFSICLSLASAYDCRLLKEAKCIALHVSPSATVAAKSNAIVDIFGL